MVAVHRPAVVSCLVRVPLQTTGDVPPPPPQERQDSPSRRGGEPIGSRLDTLHVTFAEFS